MYYKVIFSKIILTALCFLCISFLSKNSLAQDAQETNDARSEIFLEVDRLEETYSREYAAQTLMERFEQGNISWREMYMVAMRWQAIYRENELAINFYETILDKHDFAEELTEISFVQSSLGEALVASGRHDKAIALLESAIGIRNGTSEQQSALGQAYLARGDAIAARTHCVTAIIINPQLHDSCWQVLSATQTIALPAARHFSVTAKDAEGNVHNIDAEELFRHSIPKLWNVKELCEASNAYREVSERFERSGVNDISSHIRGNYQKRALQLAHEQLAESKNELIFSILSCMDEVFPADELELSDPYRKSFYFLLSLAHIRSRHYRLALNSIHKLAETDKNLLNTYDEDGKYLSNTDFHR